MRCARPADTALTANSCPTDMIPLSAIECVSLPEILALLSFTVLPPVARFDDSSSVCIDDFKVVFKVGGRGYGCSAGDYSSLRNNRLLASRVKNYYYFLAVVVG